MTGIKITWAFITLGIDILLNPSFGLLKVVGMLIAIDFVTGVMKAKVNKVERTSEGYRKTIVKLLQYLVPVIVLYVSGRLIPEYKDMLHKASGYVMLFVAYIETTSIFENLYEIDNRSYIAKFLYKPALVILKFGLEYNQVKKAADEVKNKIDNKN